VSAVSTQNAEVAVRREPAPDLVAEGQTVLSRAQQDLIRAERAGAEEQHRRGDHLLVAVGRPVVAVRDGVAPVGLRDVADLRERTQLDPLRGVRKPTAVERLVQRMPGLWQAAQNAPALTLTEGVSFVDVGVAEAVLVVLGDCQVEGHPRSRWVDPALL